MFARFQHQETAGGAERKTASAFALPDGGVRLFQIEVAEFIEDEQIGAFAIMRCADQCDLALSGRDARQRDPRRVDGGCFLAHEGARRAAHAVHDGDVAGQQVGELRQKQRRPQIVHQPFVEKAGS